MSRHIFASAGNPPWKPMTAHTEAVISRPLPTRFAIGDLHTTNLITRHGCHLIYRKSPIGPREMFASYEIVTNHRPDGGHTNGRHPPKESK